MAPMEAQMNKEKKHVMRLTPCQILMVNVWGNGKARLNRVCMSEHVNLLE